ncbi:hypothetical protein M5689_022149 [Euphorbia peplus]|nr:hypothetical protein M5689_022149 [Euphorbia peplus]
MGSMPRVCPRCPASFRMQYNRLYPVQD